MNYLSYFFAATLLFSTSSLTAMDLDVTPPADRSLPPGIGITLLTPDLWQRLLSHHKGINKVLLASHPIIQESTLNNLVSLDSTNGYRFSDAFLYRYATQLTNLTHLNYGFLSNKIARSDESISNLVSLRFLELDRCPDITNKGISNLTNLTSLKLTNDKQFNGANISNLTNLTSLHLEDTEENVQDNHISGLTNLTSLSLEGNYYITDAALLKLASLRFLNLIDNDEITSDGYSHIQNLQVIKDR